MKGFLLGIVTTLLVLVGIAMFVAKTGRVNFSADQPPSQTEKHLAMSAVDASTDRHAPEVKNPLQVNEANLASGAELYMNHCAGCHGLPSNPDSSFAKAFNPPVPVFFKEAPDMAENQNFYIIQHGIRWSGMPAWGSSLSETQIWQLVTFLGNVEKLPPPALKKLEVQPGTTVAP
jgi:mono/diheme cytochrome c family protein